jgi:hypothetical protein
MQAMHHEPEKQATQSFCVRKLKVLADTTRLAVIDLRELPPLL